ncbi:MAG: hypothetical protein A2W86_02135 [Bacteroidetes bacterium GWD2_45_23]|nr:MAG: hypothetical protein A2W87_00845 [Bacteroidetes bacterium GWC2_46_850]OFX87224.1 MAG: hypothetical protein A2W86_02135 [Bacteroidetes bacterium GWD2_45_23]HBB01760.1 hypothetical protein [Porphyromonadaceae bacterium]HCC17070.1 hypothetical protein [Porphyromonadaceae bacterium]
MIDKNAQPDIFQPVHLWPLSIVVAGIGACFAGAAVSRSYWDFFGLLLILSLASLLVGTLFGFLFGIPRLNRNYDPRGDGGRTTKYMPNTNLEDVSDWLTKIIIGVTLTQLTKIPGYLQSIADNILANSNCNTMNCNFAGTVITSLLIYFFITGFTSGYYYTRLFLPNLFSIMEENSIKRAEIAIWREGAQQIAQRAGESEPDQTTAFLTADETDILRKIKAHNNQLTTLSRLTYREIAAVNVLRAKGIVDETPEGPDRRIGSLRIVNADVLHSLP